MTEQELRKQVADTINGWVGGTKGSAKHLDILATYNNHKPLARGYKVKAQDAYCATTVSAAYIKAGIAEYTGTECGCGYFIQEAKKRGIWVENDAYVPKVGDAVLYDWQDSGAGDNIGAPDHIGIVTQVNGSKTFTVAEGNMSGGKIGTRSMRVNGRYIRGFICPDFAAIAKKLSSSKTDAALDKLAGLGVISAPDYWRTALLSGKVKYLDTLIIKATAKARKSNIRSSTPENGIGALVRAGVIDSPDYWLEHYHDYPNLGDLLCALGGAVQ